MEKIRKIGADRREKGETVIIKLESEEMKRRIMRDKWKLKGDGVWIEDLTWKERKVRWRLRQIALKEKWRGKKDEDERRGDLG